MLLRHCTKLFSVLKNVHTLKLIRQQPPLISSQLCDIKPLSGFRYQHQSVAEEDQEELTETRDVIQKVNNEIHNKTYGRLFAVVQVCGKQFKITDEDIIVVTGYWAPTAGDKIRLEKVLLVGSANFTLIGRPILPLDQVAVYATVIEKTMSSTVVRFVMRRRKRFKRTKLNRIQETFLRITSIDVNLGVNEIGDVDGLRDRIF